MQSGFMPKDSTTHQLVYLYHVLGEALDNNKEVCVEFGDISKAFDRVWHAGLLTKLSSIGITGQLNNWFSNYLSARAQRVVLGSEQSDLMPIKAGVPQGPVIGPILFLVYINDIADELECRVSLFADDNILYIFADTVDECANVLNRDLEEMGNWAYTWLVTFDAKKTCDMPLSLQTRTVNFHCHLGLTLTLNLKWSAHINNISIRANKRLAILNKLSFKINRKGLEQLYFAYVRSILEYGDIVFANAAQNDLSKLDKIHKRAAKIVAGGIRGVSSCTLFKELSWETLSQRRENRRILMFSDIVHHRSPTYLQDLLPGSVESRSGHRYSLRNSDLMDTFSCRTETFKSSFFPYSTIFWNNLDENLNAIDERSILKSNLAKKRVNKNKYYLSGPRTTNIILAHLRMGCSELRVHLNCLHVSESTKCCCGKVETTEHFFLSCTLYISARNELQERPSIDF